MFKRMLFLILLAVATVSVSLPVSAASLTVTWTAQVILLGDDDEYFPHRLVFRATASGGTAPYTYRWYRDSILQTTYTTTGSSSYSMSCYNGYKQRTFQVIVTDSMGAQVATPPDTWECS